MENLSASTRPCQVSGLRLLPANIENAFRRIFMHNALFCSASLVSILNYGGRGLRPDTFPSIRVPVYGTRGNDGVVLRVRVKFWCWVVNSLVPLPELVESRRHQTSRRGFFASAIYKYAQNQFTFDAYCTGHIAVRNLIARRRIMIWCAQCQLQKILITNKMPE